MPNSCRNILKKLVYKGALTEQEYEKILRNLHTGDIVYCKDCKHRPELADPEAERFGYNVRESDGVCPCTNADDRYYSWMPEDNWFCGDGERKDG